MFIAEEVRHYLAELGYQSIDQIVGNAALLKLKDSYEAKGIKLGLNKLQERFRPNKKQYNSSKNRINSELNDYELSTAIDKQLKSNILKGKGVHFLLRSKILTVQLEQDWQGLLQKNLARMVFQKN